MRLRDYPETDSLYDELPTGRGVKTQEVWNSLNVDLDAEGNVVGFDTEHASRQLDLSTLETTSLPLQSARIS